MLTDSASLVARRELDSVRWSGTGRLHCTSNARSVAAPARSQPLKGEKGEAVLAVMNGEHSSRCHSVAPHLFRTLNMNKLLDQAFDHVMQKFSAEGYRFWENQIEQEPIIFPHPDDADKEIEITARWDSVPRQAIRVLVSILHSTRFGIVLPIKSFLVHPDNSIKVPT